MSRYFLKILYQGTQYSGWQIQPGIKTIQGEIAQALSTILGHSVDTMGCGRTDAGVHARAQVMHFDTNKELNPTFLRHLNFLLPKDISAHSLSVSSIENAHARYSATWRHYRYFVHFQKNPFLHSCSLQLPYSPNKAILTECAQLLIGTHDFGAFGKKKLKHKTTICTVYEAGWHFFEEQWYFEIRADRFLRGMVRMLVGSMLRIARDNSDCSEFHRYLTHPEAMMARPSAEPQGLTFWDAGYPENFFQEHNLNKLN
jgi:tRNA pseudouridine38-40 synthase